MKYTLSIITVCRNSENTIHSTVESVLSQNYDDFEYIIIDGKSEDQTIDIIQEFNNSRIKLISEIDNGLWDAMNKGVSKSNGKYVTFLNSDDVFKDEFVVSNSLQFLQKENLDLMYGFVDMYDENLISVYRQYRVNELSLNFLKKGIMPAHPGSFIKRSLFNKLNGFQYNLDVPPDFYMFLSINQIQKVRTGCHPNVLVKMRRGGVGHSSIIFKFKRQLYIINALKLYGIKVSILSLVLGKFFYRRKEFSID